MLYSYVEYDGGWSSATYEVSVARNTGIFVSNLIIIPFVPNSSDTKPISQYRVLRPHAPELRATIDAPSNAAKIGVIITTYLGSRFTQPEQ